MGELQTDVIVLRRSDYRDWDRMLTLFSPEHGRIEAAARGIRKPAARLKPAGEPFATGHATLMVTGDRATLTGFELTEGFYPLRERYERLTHAAYALNACARIVQQSTPDPALFALLQRTLGFLAYSDRHEGGLLARFLLNVLSCEGVAPTITVCARCGRDIDSDTPSDELRFSITEGGLCCAACMPFAQRIRSTTLEWLRNALLTDMADDVAGDADAGLRLMRLAFENYENGGSRAGGMSGVRVR